MRQLAMDRVWWAPPLTQVTVGGSDNSIYIDLEGVH